MVSFRDYETCLLFLLLVKFHGSSKCEIYSPVEKIFQYFYHLSLETENADPLFLNVMFVKMISELQGSLDSFCISKLRYDVGNNI